VCRLELVYDQASEKMVVAPFDNDHHVEPPAKPRTIPLPATERKKTNRRD